MHIDYVPDMAAKRAELTPDRMAFVDRETGARLSFGEINALADALAHALVRLRIAPGDRVAVICLNRPEFFVLLFAVQKLGAILLPLNWRQPAAELSPIVSEAGVRLLFHDAAFEATARELAAAHGLPRIGLEHGCDADHDLAALLAEAPATAFGSGRIDAAAPWYLLATSGTTGTPKLVIQTARMAWANAINYSQAVDLTSADTSVNFLPLFHTAGINLLTLPLFLMGGCSTVLRKFDAGQMLDLFGEGAVSAILCVPAVYQALALHERFAATDFSAVRSLACGGAPIPAPLLRTYLDRGLPICNGMGMTETGPTVFLLDRAHAAEKIGSVGKAQMLAEVRLVDPHGKIVEGAGTGELQIRGPCVTPGYFGNPQATAKAFTADGWLLTGDVARRDEDGYFVIVDRIKDMYISGGENVYPAEVERVLVTHEDVQEAVVVGIADARWGEVGAAFLIPRPGRTIDTAALVPWCRERLAAYKVPKSFHVVSDLPRTAAGKVQKHLLKAGFGDVAVREASR